MVRVYVYIIITAPLWKLWFLAGLGGFGGVNSRAWREELEVWRWAGEREREGGLHSTCSQCECGFVRLVVQDPGQEQFQMVSLSDEGIELPLQRCVSARVVPVKTLTAAVSSSPEDRDPAGPANIEPWPFTSLLSQAARIHQASASQPCRIEPHIVSARGSAQCMQAQYLLKHAVADCGLLNVETSRSHVDSRSSPQEATNRKSAKHALIDCKCGWAAAPNHALSWMSALKPLLLAFEKAPAVRRRTVGVSSRKETSRQSSERCGDAWSRDASGFHLLLQEVVKRRC